MMSPMEFIVREGIVSREDVSAVRQMDGSRIVALDMSIRVWRAEKAGGMSFVGRNSNARAGQPTVGAIFEGPAQGFGNIINRQLQRTCRMQFRRSRNGFCDRVARY